MLRSLLLTQTPRLLDEFLKGGLVMFPLLLLSILTLATALERGIFWIELLTQEDRIVRDVLDAAAEDLAQAREIAEYARVNVSVNLFCDFNYVLDWTSDC